MLPLLLGLGAALAYGTSDFLGGLLARRIHFGLVSVIGATAAFGVTLLAALVVGGAAPTPSALVLGAISGVGGGLGTMALYRGLGRGQMGIVAPLSALGTAALPVLIGVILGDRPSVAAWAGVALALPAVWLVSTSASSDGGGSLGAGVIDGLLAGVGFALLLTGLGLAGDASGLWPVVASQAMASIVLGIVLMGVLRKLDRRRPPARYLGAAALVGVVGALASASYFLATHVGLLSIVAVLTSLYPAVTVLLAATLLHEAVTRRQAIGLGAAAVAVVLIALG